MIPESCSDSHFSLGYHRLAAAQSRQTQTRKKGELRLNGLITWVVIRKQQTQPSIVVLAKGLIFIRGKLR